MAKFTIWGFENYLNPQNLSIFDHITNLPSNLDRSILIDTIKLRSNEFELLYSDPLFMREAVGAWYKKNLWTINKWAAALKVEYNPIDNYDRYEEYTDIEKSNTAHTGSQTVNGSSNNVSHIDGTDTPDETVDNSVSAYDSDTMRPESQTHTSGENKSHTDSTATDTTNSTRLDDLKDDTNRELVHKAHLHGNIGVTSSQMMLQSEFEIARFNVLDAIADLFISEFCILIY